MEPCYFCGVQTRHKLKHSEIIVCCDMCQSSIQLFFNTEVLSRMSCENIRDSEEMKRSILWRRNPLKPLGKNVFRKLC